MKKADKVLFACKEDSCGKVIGCFNIFSKESGMPCSECKVRDNCNMRAVPLKYADTFTIKQDGFCDKCWEAINGN